MRGIYKENQSLANYTTWKVGGPADRFYQPADLEDLVWFLKNLPEKEPITWLGVGSNVLIRDRGIKGTVICVRGVLDDIQQLNDFTLRVEAGTDCTRLVRYCVRLGMEDAAFLAGIPGTVGGALAMNAGAFDDNIWQHVVVVETINRQGEVKKKYVNQFSPSYREIIGLSSDEWFVAGLLQFAKTSINKANTKVKEYLQKRRETQPTSESTCGSVFRNPAQDYAAKLIETCGLKGYRIGGACIAKKHANFIINDGNATAYNIEELIHHIKDQVFRRRGVELIPEVHILGVA